MKRKLSLALCAALVFLVCAGAAVTGSGETPSYGVYFQEADLQAAPGGDALRAEPVVLGDVTGTRETAETLMTALLQGHSDETLKSPIPAGTQLLSLELEGSRAVVDLSAPYGTLSGVGLALADYAITLTLTQLPEILAVKITVRGQELAYRDKQIFTARDVLLAPKGDVVGTVPVTLYFLDENGQLASERRTLELYEGDTQVGTVVRALENGPADKGLSAVFPEGFRVQTVWLEEDVCYVNLSSAVLENMPKEEGLPLAIHALRRSLCSLEAVKEVRFLVDGEFSRTYGPVNIASPYSE